MGSTPLVSVVTPFYNTREFLRECIESVLNQTYENWEYILVDNCSTDGSDAIAVTYASRLPGKVRFIRNESFLSQVQNYNFALSCISQESKYCKIVQADDFIFPECLRLMVQAFQQSESIGLVSSYDLTGTTVRGSGLPYRATLLTGKELAHAYFRGVVFPFGSPTTVMYRSSLVRRDRPFFGEGLLHEDTEKCMQIIQQWEFGFVHQILSFSRSDNESTTSRLREFRPEPLDYYIIVQRYASEFLEPAEAKRLRSRCKRRYYAILAQEALRFRGAAFWRYHNEGVKTLGQTLDWTLLMLEICKRLLWALVNPGIAVWKVYSLVCRRRRRGAMQR